MTDGDMETSGGSAIWSSDASGEAVVRGGVWQGLRVVEIVQTRRELNIIIFGGIPVWGNWRLIWSPSDNSLWPNGRPRFWSSWTLIDSKLAFLVWPLAVFTSSEGWLEEGEAVSQAEIDCARFWGWGTRRGSQVRGCHWEDQGCGSWSWQDWQLAPWCHCQLGDQLEDVESPLEQLSYLFSPLLLSWYFPPLFFLSLVLASFFFNSSSVFFSSSFLLLASLAANCWTLSGASGLRLTHPRYFSSSLWRSSS